MLCVCVWVCCWQKNKMLACIFVYKSHSGMDAMLALCIEMSTLHRMESYKMHYFILRFACQNWILMLATQVLRKIKSNQFEKYNKRLPHQRQLRAMLFSSSLNLRKVWVIDFRVFLSWFIGVCILNSSKMMCWRQVR